MKEREVRRNKRKEESGISKRAAQMAEGNVQSSGVNKAEQESGASEQSRFRSTCQHCNARVCAHVRKRLELIKWPEWLESADAQEIGCT